MSQKDDSENDIWEYKPLEKKKKRHKSPTATVTVPKRRRTPRKSSKKDTHSSVISRDNKVKTTKGEECCAVNTPEDAHHLLPKSSTSHDAVQADNRDAEGPSGRFCPMCQMPFSILMVQTQRWHVAECLDTPRDTCKECPDGLQCSSTIPNHYKKFNHTLLAHSRANSDTALLSLYQQAGSSGKTSSSGLPGLVNDVVDASNLDPSQDSPPALSNRSDHSGTPPSKRTAGLLFLRSPGPEDFKKKKGWSLSAKSKKSAGASASQESRKETSPTPVKAASERQSSEGLLKSEPSPDSDDDSISYSPLSEFPARTQVASSKSRKSLFNNEASENDAEDSVLMFSDDFSSEDELLAEFIENLDDNNVRVNERASLSSTQLDSLDSVAPTNQLAASAVAENRAASTCEGEAYGGSTGAVSPCKHGFQSPQSIVLERLRETLPGSDRLPLKYLNDCGAEPNRASPQVPSSQTSLVQTSQTMPPQKGQSKQGQASCPKQTDIGVFFGLKPLKEKEKEAESGPGGPSASSIPTLGPNSRAPRQPRRERQRKSHADTAADASRGAVDSRDVTDAGKGRSKGWTGRRRWGRVNADGEAELPRCPFYKKIPGTKFAVDAFRYGDVEGITVYFLTHFHSDHYGGLTKNSTFPIYCNRITGNLVRSKLKVAEQYVHVLPMNTRVTVEGVTVILLDANHCPGAAMLLLLLPDGQTVLHTGDFRADPSMETYPELLNRKVQTLYLDTTYCSPEYTFPKQQEVINFAARTAFECVSLNPRTLVVCGTYSVGKEKVFLALAEVLRSKVCLSRDKYNTMCCLESGEVRQCITTDWKAAQVHVLPMMQLTFKKLQDHLARFSGQYDRLVAFKPTGWTFSQQVESVEDIQPQISGNILLFGVPYSEHSSFLEMKRFVQWLQPLKIIPTVNNGSWAGRKAMEKCFSEWLKEAKAKR